MSDLLAKISSYNIFNYLLPGVLFAVLATAWTGISFMQANLLVAAFVYYFIGMVVSRIGSLFIEPLLKWVGFLTFVDYPAFVKASAADAKIEILSEANNSYRTICALFVALCILKAYQATEKIVPILRGYGTYVLIAFLLFLFLFSYRKQTAYVVKRVKVST